MMERSTGQKPDMEQTLDIGQKIRKSRNESGLTQEQVAEAIKVSGEKEIREINMEFNARYVRGDMDKEEKMSCVM